MEDIYSNYGDDIRMSLDDFKQEVTRWRHRWLLCEDGGNPQTLVETLDFATQNYTQGFT